MDKILSILTSEFNLEKKNAENTAVLIEEGNTIPFIARYRKEQTGNMSDEVLRDFDERLAYLKNLEGRKAEVIRLIDEQGKLTPALEEKINAASILKEVEDLYVPFKPKKRTRATIAKEKGLAPLAQIIFSQNSSDEEIMVIAEGYISEEKQVLSASEAVNGACDIIAEEISENADYKKTIRNITYRNSIVTAEAAKGAADEINEFAAYYGFTEPVMSIPDHRILAINRGEAKKVLKVDINAPVEQNIQFLCGRILKRSSKLLTDTIEDSYKRLIMPSIEREIRTTLTQRADESATHVFARNLKTLLMAPPVKGKVIMGFDPGFRTGCKVAVIDSFGKYLDSATVYPTQSEKMVEKAKRDMSELIVKYKVDIIAIGNGTASRESEKFISEMIPNLPIKVEYIIVNEAGASIYSASKLGTEEYPDLNVSIRGAISIAQRLRDPLAELVKIDPKHIGVGQYQHDVNQSALSKALENVVENAVNSVGVDVNSSSPSLLGYVSGITKKTAKNIFEYVKENGGMKNRSELKKVSGIGDKVYEQCAGFLRVSGGDNILDNTAVHPESYGSVESLLQYAGLKAEELKSDFKSALSAIATVDVRKASEELNIGIYTLADIISELKKPGRDPRDELQRVVFKSEVVNLDDLKEGMRLTGTVRNITHFGAFVDIGVHEDGLVHISKLSDKFVKDPFDVVKVGDIVNVEVVEVDLKRKRISLSMKGLNQK